MTKDPGNSLQVTNANQAQASDVSHDTGLGFQAMTSVRNSTSLLLPGAAGQACVSVYESHKRSADIKMSFSTH